MLAALCSFYLFFNLLPFCFVTFKLDGSSRCIFFITIFYRFSHAAFFGRCFKEEKLLELANAYALLFCIHSTVMAVFESPS